MNRRKRAAAVARRKQIQEDLATEAEQRQWLYHGEHEPKIFTGEDAIEAALADGWEDSPAKCKGFLDKIDVDPNNKMQVQYIGEVTEQAAEAINLIENLDTLTGPQMTRLAELQFAEDWSKRRDKLTNRRAVLTERLTEANVVAVVPAPAAE